MEDEKLREEVLAKAREYFRLQSGKKKQGSIKVPVSGKVLFEEDIAALVDASLDGWLTAGRFTDAFESALGSFFGLKHCLMVNSGSSANLVALSALTSKMMGAKRLRAGDEVLTCATAFPTTVNPIFQNNLVPVFVDAELSTGNIDLELAEKAITKKTRAIMAAHTLGSPFDLAKASELCKEHSLFLIEDCCDALGAKFNGKPVGTFGDACTLSFYPAHHITTGEGGAVLTSNPLIARAAESMRDWGRDCWCKTGCDNTCGKRFGWKLGSLPHGYDHKYIYSNIGYNLKATDMQAALGLSQLSHLPQFVHARQENFNFYLSFFQKYKEHFVLPVPCKGAEPSPFGYLVNIRQNAPFSRAELAGHLESNGIATRTVFGGNMVRQPSLEGTAYRVEGKLENSDHLMNNAFWIGVYPGITQEMRTYVAEKLSEFLNKRKVA